MRGGHRCVGNSVKRPLNERLELVKAEPFCVCHPELPICSVADGERTLGSRENPGLLQKESVKTGSGLMTKPKSSEKLSNLFKVTHLVHVEPGTANPGSCLSPIQIPCMSELSRN